jgi:hypothetical protein
MKKDMPRSWTRQRYPVNLPQPCPAWTFDAVLPHPGKSSPWDGAKCQLVAGSTLFTKATRASI